MPLPTRPTHRPSDPVEQLSLGSAACGEQDGAPHGDRASEEASGPGRGVRRHLRPWQRRRPQNGDTGGRRVGACSWSPPFPGCPGPRGCLVAHNAARLGGAGLGPGRQTPRDSVCLMTCVEATAEQRPVCPCPGHTWVRTTSQAPGAKVWAPFQIHRSWFVEAPRTDHGL